MSIQKIMEKDEAQEEYNRICAELDISDLDAICDEEDEASILNKKKMFQGIMCGLIKYDPDKGLVQTLIKPLVKGDLTPRTELYYKNKLTMKNMHEVSEGKGTKTIHDMLTIVTTCPKALIGELGGEDLMIAKACLGFFDK